MKKNYNWKLFSKYQYYVIQNVAEKLNFSFRTISENWRKEGLKIKNGKIYGADLIEFLKIKKTKRKKATLGTNEFYCFTRKKTVEIPTRLHCIDFDERIRRFKITAYCNSACSTFYCGKNTKLSKLISYADVMKRFTEIEQYPEISFSIKAKETIMRRIKYRSNHEK